ncbi:MAG: hypothetical protein K0U64_12135 [Actinomycetia bacterium]|nr:hypothetical protein [Actinomycetes bacterium]
MGEALAGEKEYVVDGLHVMHVFLAVCAVLVFGLLVWLAYTIIQQQLEDRKAATELASGSARTGGTNES